MKFIDIFGACLIILVLILISVAAADIGLYVSCYNSEDDMSFSLDAENIDYDGAFELEPDAISFKNIGESTAPECSYSLEQSFNEDSAHSSASTDSGYYKWAAQMSTSSGIDDSNSSNFKVLASHKVDDGFLSSGYGNDWIAVRSNIIASKANYSELAAITPDSLIAAGSGETHFQETPDTNMNVSYEALFGYGVLNMSGEYYHVERGSGASETSSEQGSNGTESEAEESDQLPTEIDILPGFIQEVDVVAGDDWAHIKGAVIGKKDDAVINWAYGLKSGSDSLSNEYPFTLAMAATGISQEGFKIMAMEGEGSDIPVQRLPPGNFSIEYQSDIDSTLYDLIKSQYPQFINNQTNEFYEEYASPDDTIPFTWYSWNHRAFISIGGIDRNDLDSEDNEFEYFKMSMKFEVNPDEAIEGDIPMEDRCEET